MLVSLPIATSAFWPFSTLARAANTGGEPPILHDSSISLLEAATNQDPDPSKGANDIALTEDTALVANSGPAGTLADIDTSSAATASGGQIATYVVKEGDSISAIAAKFDVSVNTILWANNLTAKSAIKPGMNLVILPISGIRHTVQKGETLGSIAKKYSGAATEIATFNGLDAGDALVTGTTIIIPGGEITTVAPVKKPTKTGSVSPLPATTSSGSTSGYYDNPVPGAILTQGLHLGYAVDLGSPAGTPIHAAASGTVIVSKGDGAWNGGYGSYVVISHANGTQTLYAHMSKDVVAVGEKVSQDDVIGYVGRTGEATGNHLHFEVRGARNPFASSCKVMSKCY